MPHELDEAQDRAEAHERAIESWIDWKWRDLVDRVACEQFVSDWNADQDVALLIEFVADAKSLLRQGHDYQAVMEFLGKSVTAWATNKVMEAAKHSVQPGFFTGEY